VKVETALSKAPMKVNPEIAFDLTNNATNTKMG
jgi:hypothetical protein